MRSTMRRVCALFTGAVLLATALAASAQSAPKPVGDTAQSARQLPTVRGVVASVGETALAVGTGTPGRELRFVLDARTVVMTMKPMKRIGAAELRKGDAVTVAYEEEARKLVARRVWVRPGGSATGATSGTSTAATTP